MERRGPLVIHCTADESYFLVIMPNERITAVSNESVLGLDADLEGLRFDGAKTSCRMLLTRGETPMLVEQWKATALPIFKEMKEIQRLARQYHVRNDMVEIMIHPNPRRYVSIMTGECDPTGADQAHGDAMDSRRNRVMTTVMVYDVWVHETHDAYCRWFRSVYAA